VIAPYLTELQARVKKEGIRVGSCKFNCLAHSIAARLIPDPFLYKGVHVSLIGHDVERIKELGKEVSSCQSIQVLADELGRPGTGRQDRLGGYSRLREGDRKDLIVCMSLSRPQSPFLPP